MPRDLPRLTANLHIRGLGRPALEPDWAVENLPALATDAYDRSVRPTGHIGRAARWLCLAAACGTVAVTVLTGPVFVPVAVARPGADDRNANATAVRYRGPDARAIPRRSRSLGYPWRGRLQRGVQAVENRFVRYTGEYADSENFWGTWELVQLVERAAYRVWQRLPGARLSIGELSAPEGGDIEGHASHENGRDVDLSFYMLDGRGQPFDPYGFADFDAAGRGLGANEGLRFDDARNWELVAKLVADGDARVQYIFVADSLKERMLAEGRRRGAPSAVLDRAERVMVQPARGHPHRNHFHVRIYCAPGDRPACQDRAPFHAWYPGEPPFGPASELARGR